MNFKFNTKVSGGRLTRRQVPYIIMTRAAPRNGAKRGGPPAANQSRAASVAPGSYDTKLRSFRVILSTGASVKRYGFNEELSMDPAAVDLSRVALGQVKFLDSHNQGAVGAIIGTVTDVRFENGLLVGTVQLGESEAARAIEPDIAAGHIKGVSIGYHVDQWTLVATGDVDTWRADKWTLLEASAVSVPADAGAMIRAAESDDEFGEQGFDEPPAARGANAKDRNLSAKDYKFLLECNGREFASTLDQMIEDGKSRSVIYEAARIYRAARAAVNPANFIGGPNPHLCEEMNRVRLNPGDPYPSDFGGRSYMHANAQTLDNPQFLRQTLEDALYSRMTGKPPEGAARQFVGARLEDFDDILGEASGERRSWLSRGPGRWFGGGARAMHTTSDFTNLLLGSGNRVLQDSFDVAQSPLMLLSRVRISADFRPINVLKVSEAPELLEIKEGGEIKYGSRGEEAEAFSVKTFGRLFSLSRQAYANDDLSAFADFLLAFGRAAAETAAGQMVALFTANTGNGVNLSDSNALFTTARGNKAAAGTVIDVTNLGAARQALRETKGLDGKTPIGLTPRYLVVGPAKETQAEQAISAIMANQTSNANPFAGRLEVLVEPRFTGNAWRVFADPAQQSVISHAFLNGRSGPILETREGWTTLGVEFRAVLDFGCGATDWRGAYLNPGA
jgi:HK97 family phage prohead protease